MSEEGGTAEKALYFVLGAFVGAATALLLAPRSGEETRRMIATKARDGADYISTQSRQAAEKTTGLVERSKGAVQQQRDQLSAALEAGKQAYKEEKEKAST